MKYVWYFLIAVVLIDVIALLAFTSVDTDTAKAFIVAEDGIVENLTVGLYLRTFLFALVLFNTQSKSDATCRKWLILLMVLGLLGFLEEISFGERLFNLNMPMLGGVKIDALHDFIDVGIILVSNLITDYQLPALLLLLSVFILFLFVLLKYGKRLWGAFVAESYYPLHLMMFFFVVLAFLALLMDAEFFPFKGDLALEECFELNAALALLTSCLIIFKLKSDKTLPR